MRKKWLNGSGKKLIEHGEELRRLYSKLNNNGQSPLAVPRVITVYQRCIKHHLQDKLITELHFNDLHLLLMHLDIEDIKQILKQKSKEKMRANGIGDVKTLSPNEAVKFLKGG